MRPTIVDSNIWIAAIDEAHEWHRRATLLLRDLATTTIVVPAVVQMEVVHYFRRADGPAVRAAVAGILRRNRGGPSLDARVLEGADAILQEHTGMIGARDAAILVHVRDAGAKLLTMDGKLAAAATAMGFPVEHTDPRSA